MFYICVFVACNNDTLRNMNTNLRGSDDIIEIKIENYTKAIGEPTTQNLRNNENYTSSGCTDDKFPDGFVLEQYLVERNWKNVIKKHLLNAEIMGNA